MAYDAFLKIDGIDGESKDERHPNEIEVLSFSWGESNSGSAATGGGAGAGKVAMQDFHFTMKLNKASPQLFLATVIARFASLFTGRGEIKTEEQIALDDVVEADEPTKRPDT